MTDCQNNFCARFIYIEFVVKLYFWFKSWGTFTLKYKVVWFAVYTWISCSISDICWNCAGDIVIRSAVFAVDPKMKSPYTCYLMLHCLQWCSWGLISSAQSLFCRWLCGFQPAVLLRTSWVHVITFVVNVLLFKNCTWHAYSNRSSLKIVSTTNITCIIVIKQYT